MSHSKRAKRGKSLYLDQWNPSAKRFINTCALCGAQGYRPSIEEDGFVYSEAKTINDFEHRAILSELTRVLKPLPLDHLGRCPDCAKRMGEE